MWVFISNTVYVEYIPVPIDNALITDNDVYKV